MCLQCCTSCKYVNTWENTNEPYNGTDEERKEYVKYFNNRLKYLCEKNNYIFIDIFDKYKDENGFLIKELSDTGIHIKDGKYIKEFIENIFFKSTLLLKLFLKFEFWMNKYCNYLLKTYNLNILY